MRALIVGTGALPPKGPEPSTGCVLGNPYSLRRSLTDLRRPAEAEYGDLVLPDLHLAGWAMVAGGILFLVGAGLAPEPSKVFTADREAYLDVLHRRSRRWGVMTILMVSGVAATSAGLVALGSRWREPLGIAATIFTIGTVFWLVTLIARATVDVEVAHTAAKGGAVADWFGPWQRFTGACFKTYILLAYASLFLVGGALLRGGAPRLPGWFAVTFGAAAFVGNVTGRPQTKGFGPVFEPPFMVHLPTLVIGIWLVGLR